MATLNVGDLAPEFELMDQDRATVKLSGLSGKTVVLLFYPMDFSPVCTAEHCAFGPGLSTIAPDDSTVVYGVNADHPFSHAAFRERFAIPYPLLSDPTRRMIKAYGMFGGEEPFNCAKRGTVVIGPDGTVKHNSTVGVDDERSVESLRAAAAGS